MENLCHVFAALNALEVVSKGGGNAVGSGSASGGGSGSGLTGNSAGTVATSGVTVAPSSPSVQSQVAAAQMAMLKDTVDIITTL